MTTELPDDSVLTLDEYLQMQRTIGEPTRYRALDALLQDGAQHAPALADTLDVPANRLHYHLDQLEDAGLIVNRKRRDRGSRTLDSTYEATALGDALMNHGVAELIEEEHELLARYA